MRALLVEDFDEVVEPSLLLKEVSTGRLGGFLLQGEMAARVATRTLASVSNIAAVNRNHCFVHVFATVAG